MKKAAIRKRVLSYLSVAAVLTSMFAWMSGANLVKAATEPLFTDAHTDVLHVWAEAARGENGMTGGGVHFTAWYLPVSGYIFAAGDRLVYDVYTDSDGAASSSSDYPAAGIGNDADWGYFGNESYVNGLSAADGSAYRAWKRMDVPVPNDTFTKCTLMAGVPDEQGGITRSDAYFDNIKILDAAGAVKLTLFESAAQPVFRYHTGLTGFDGQGARVETAAEAARPATDYLRVSLTGMGQDAWAHAYLPGAHEDSDVRFAEGDYLEYDVYFESGFFNTGGMDIWNRNGIGGESCCVMLGSDASSVAKVNSTWPVTELSQMVVVDDSYRRYEMFRYWRTVRVPVNVGHVFATDCKMDLLRIGALLDDNQTITMRLRGIVLKNSNDEVKYEFYTGGVYSSRYDSENTANNSNVSGEPFHFKSYEISAYSAADEPIIPLDPAPANAVVEMIDALPAPADLTLGDEAAVVGARSAYNLLTVAQKEMVTNLSKLTEAEAKLDLLKNPVVFNPSETYTEFRAKFTPDPDASLGFSVKYALIGLEKPARSVRLAQGDKLIYELYLDTLTPGVGFLDVAATDGTRGHAINGSITASDGFTSLSSDFTAKAYLKWYERTVMLGSVFDGKTLDTLSASAYQGANMADGPYVGARFRNIRIVGGDGVVKYVFDSGRYYYDETGLGGYFNLQNNPQDRVEAVSDFVISNWKADDTRVPNPDGDTEPVKLLSSDAGALPSINGTFASLGGDTYTVRLPKGTDVSALTPVFTLSKGASISKTGVQDFTNPVPYTVTSEDGNTVKTFKLRVLLSDDTGEKGESYLEFRAKFTEDPGLALGFPAKYALGSLEPPTDEIILQEGDRLSYEVMLETYTPGIGYLGIETDKSRTSLSENIFYSDWRRGIFIDLMEDAYMKWYSRYLVIGSDMDGQKVKSLEVAVQIKEDTEAGSYLAAAFRNIRLTDSDGNLKYRFDCDRYYYDDSFKYGAFNQRNIDETTPSVEKSVFATYNGKGSRIQNPDGLSQDVSLLSSETIIAAVSVNGVEGMGSFGNFTVVVPAGTDLTGLTPSFVLPTGASIDKTGAQDFSGGPVSYTVTAEDGKQRAAYTLAVEEEYEYVYDPGDKDPGGDVPYEEIPDTGGGNRLPVSLLFVGALAAAGMTAISRKRGARR